MAKEIVFLVEESEDGGYQATAVGHCICTQAETMEELKESVRDAVCCHFEEADLPGTICLRLEDDQDLLV